MSIGLGSGFSEVRTTVFLTDGRKCLHLCNRGYCKWQYNTEGAFLGPEETFSIMVRGVFQVQERGNNERISDFFF